MPCHPRPSPHPHAARARPAEIHIARLVVTILLMTESTQETIVYVPPVNMTRTSLTPLRLAGNPVLSDSETSITNEEIEAYEADRLLSGANPPSPSAEQLGWVDDSAEVDYLVEGMPPDIRSPEP
jgi:hypothetical protein